MNKQNKLKKIGDQKMTTQRNIQFFTLQVNEEKQIIFRCHTTWTRSGFCHTVISLDNNFYTKMITDTKTSYFNRTWERYDYENTLKRACKKIGKKVYNLAFVQNQIKRTY